MTSRMYENPPMGGTSPTPDPAHEPRVPPRPQATNEPRATPARPHTNEPRTTRPQTSGARAAQPPSPRAVQEAAKDLTVAAKSFRDITHGYLAEQARERPYVLVGGAAAVGFVLGGGLASRVTMSLLVVGARMFGGRILAKVLEGELALADNGTDETNRA